MYVDLECQTSIYAESTIVARGDSPLTLSKSCTDKLSMKECTSLLCTPTSLLISPGNAYLHSLILPSSQYVASACDRAFSKDGRMRGVYGKRWSGGYAFQPFDVKTTDREFVFSRRRPGSPTARPKGSNIAALWTPRLQETIINGVLQGRKQSDPRGASAVCRARMWKAALDTIALLALPALAHILSTSRHSHLSASDLFEERRHVKEDVRKEALRGWIRNEVDDFELAFGEQDPRTQP